MICVSIGRMTFPRLIRVLSTIPFGEIRLDKNTFTIQEVEQIFAMPFTSIATCRPDTHTETERRQLLLAAIEAGASYIDISIENGGDFRQPLMAAAREHGCRVILSHHDYQSTPPLDSLKEIIANCFNQGADICKIACQVLNQADAARLLSLYDQPGIPPESLIALGMGDIGRITRIAGPLLAAPFTYAAFSDGMETAPGQLDRVTLSQIFAALGVKK